MSVFVGVDVGERRVFPAMIDTGRGEAKLAEKPLQPADAVEWIVAAKPKSVGIDAPSLPNRGLLADATYRTKHKIDIGAAGVDRRVAEWKLGIGGCYSTRSNRASCPVWMLTGMHLFAALQSRGHTLDLGAGGDLFEVHPTYGFKSLVSVQSTGARVRCDPERRLRPKMPAGSPGHRQRLGLIAALLKDLKVSVTDADYRRMVDSLDWTDALLGAALGVLRERGESFHVGDDGAVEGAITLSLRTVLLPEIEESPETRPRSHARRGRRMEADGIVLRLGADAFELLDQDATIDTIEGLADTEDQVIFPVQRSSIGKTWPTRAADQGLRVLLAFGNRIRVELLVTDVIGAGEGNPTAWTALGESTNPWPIEAAPYWLVAGASETSMVDRSANEIETQHNGRWALGLPHNQTSWVRFREPPEE